MLIVIDDNLRCFDKAFVKRNPGKKGWDWCSCSFSCHPFLYHYFRSLYQYISPLYHYILYNNHDQDELEEDILLHSVAGHLQFMLSILQSSPMIQVSTQCLWGGGDFYDSYDDDKMTKHHILLRSRFSNGVWGSLVVSWGLIRSHVWTSMVNEGNRPCQTGIMVMFAACKLHCCWFSACELNCFFLQPLSYIVVFLQHASKIVWRMETVILVATLFLLVLTLNRWPMLKLWLLIFCYLNRSLLLKLFSMLNVFNYQARSQWSGVWLVLLLRFIPSSLGNRHHHHLIPP